MKVPIMDLSPYVAPSAWIDADHPDVAEQARILARGAADEQALVRRCFEFVRDEIQHSRDFKHELVTCKASDVLRHRTGYCYAKSHLLAALLRVHGIPTGLCYQRLSVSDDGGGAPYCLHGLNAVWLTGLGWYRVDARGNKPGVRAAFTPPVETLAFALRDPMERDLPEIWAEPLPCVIDVLQRCKDVDEVARNLPDVPLISMTD